MYAWLLVQQEYLQRQFQEIENLQTHKPKLTWEISGDRKLITVFYHRYDDYDHVTVSSNNLILYYYSNISKTVSPLNLPRHCKYVLSIRHVNMYIEENNTAVIMFIHGGRRHITCEDAFAFIKSLALAFEIRVIKGDCEN